MVPTRRVTDYLAIGLGIVSGTVVMIRPSSGKEVSYIRYELLVTVEGASIDRSRIKIIRIVSTFSFP
jgi:hypothetical protein